uniref:Uncharacterized protein n=1 Tax=Anguilla anguilla TaxID=7936 RepID=A0A0E9QP38_ANGAN
MLSPLICVKCTDPYIPNV